MKNHKEIHAEIDALKSLAPIIRQTSAFGDDNRAAIEAQIHVLEDGLSEDDVCVYYDDSESNVRDSAIEAVLWRDEQSDEPAPSTAWAPLAK